MYQMLFGKKMTSKQRLKMRLNKLLTNERKEKLWIRNYGEEFYPHCDSCKKYKISPYNCQWAHYNQSERSIEFNEMNIKPICEICDIKMEIFN